MRQTDRTKLLGLALVLMASACAGTGERDTANSGSPGDDSGIVGANPGGNPAAGTRPSGQPQEVTYQGRIQKGVECPVLHTPDGEVFALSLGEADFGPGDYVRVTGEFADASFCMQGKGTLIATRIDAIAPPARDRDPARAGGIAVTTQYVQGSWAPKGGDCRKPAFTVHKNANGGSILETTVNGRKETAYVDVGPSPSIRFDEPLVSPPIETRGPDGLAVMLPEGGAAFSMGGVRIEGDGVVFVKCG